MTDTPSLLIIIVCFLAGMLTVFAPCVFTFLPIVLGSTTKSNLTRRYHAVIVVGSLGISVIIFSLLLRASTALIMVPPRFWEIVAGGIIFAQGLVILFPSLWENIVAGTFIGRAGGLLAKTSQFPGWSGSVLTGAALGPVFSSCSPTYGFIIGILLQASFGTGILYLASYVAGLCILLLAISLLGQWLVNKLKWGINPHGYFKRLVALVFIIIGLFIGSGLYKDVEIFIIESLPFLDITRIDRSILDRVVS